MRPMTHTRVLCALALVLGLAACGDGDGVKATDVEGDVRAQEPEARPAEPGPTTLQACADPPPTTLPRPPSGALPCELLPPTFKR